MITKEIIKHIIEIKPRKDTFIKSKFGRAVAKYKQPIMTKRQSNRIIIFSVFISFLIYNIKVQKRSSPVQTPLNVIS